MGKPGQSASRRKRSAPTRYPATPLVESRVKEVDSSNGKLEFLFFF